MIEFQIKDVSDLNWKRSLDFVSEERRNKALSYKFDRDRKLCVGAELLLKEMLHVKEREILEFRYSDNGKPYLKNRNIFFNFSHSGKYVMCAISDSETGCDIESISNADLKISEKFFSEEENRRIKNSQDSKKEFTAIWTIKESYLKLTGKGICNDLSSVTINFENHTVNDCFYTQSDVIPGYIITVCTKCFENNRELTLSDA